MGFVDSYLVEGLDLNEGEHQLGGGEGGLEAEEVGRDVDVAPRVFIRARIVCA